MATGRGRRRVVVAGGGPAGLEAARRLAEAGHDVELWEAGPVLGGRLRLAEAADPDLAGLRDWLVGAATDAGVRVSVGRAASPEAALAAGADELVWATGGDWSPRLHGALGVDELAPWLAGDDDALVGARVAVHGSGKAALSMASAAAARGRTVALVTDGTAVLAPELGLPGRFRLVADCRAAGIEVVASVDAVVADTVVDVRPAATVPPVAVDGLAVHVVGDATGRFGLADGLAGAAAVPVRAGR